MELIKAEIKLSAILNKLKLPFMKVTTLLLLLRVYIMGRRGDRNDSKLN